MIFYDSAHSKRCAFGHWEPEARGEQRHATPGQRGPPPDTSFSARAVPRCWLFEVPIAGSWSHLALAGTVPVSSTSPKSRLREQFFGWDLPCRLRVGSNEAQGSPLGEPSIYISINIFERRISGGSWSARTLFWQPWSGRPACSSNPGLAT